MGISTFNRRCSCKCMTDLRFYIIIQNQTHISYAKKWPVIGKMWLFQIESGYNLGMLGMWGWTSALCEVPKDA